MTRERFEQIVKSTTVEEIIKFAGLAMLIMIATSFSAQAALYPEAKAIVLSEDSNIAVTFEGSDAGYNNLFGIHNPIYKELFWGHSAIPGTKFDLGYFPKYTELVFFIKSPDGIFLSGPASRNPDNTVHAAITDVDSQTLRMGFEDAWNGGDRDYNDITALVAGNLYIIPSNPSKPDFIIMPGDITFSNNNPTEGDIVEIQASIRNFGSSVSSDVTLEFYDGDPDAGGKLIISSTIHGIAKEENVIKTVAWDTTGEVGIYNIYVKIDPGNLIDESKEDNNKVSQKITIESTPDKPSELSQFKSDGTTVITTGYTTNERTVVFKSTISDSDKDQVKLQIELRRLDEYGGQFDETQPGIKESILVPSGSGVTITVNDLIDADYHWRARAVDVNGNKGPWQEFGGNDISAADFVIYMPAALIPVLQWPLKEKSYVNGFAFGDDWIVESKKGLKDSKCGPDWKSHTGVDLNAKLGDDVLASYDGVVKVVYNAGLGWAEGIVIEHTAPDNSKFTTTYIHVNALIKEKAKVAKKDKIATIADIDGSDHLHFGVRNSGYSKYAQRGALPKNNLYKGPGNHCKTDPIFSEEYFIDPMKLNYEYN